MKTLNFVQGSPEWLAHRKTARNASEAPIIFGFSKNVTRTKFLDMKVLGTEQEFSKWFEENVLENGHKVEAMARPMAEYIIGEDLYPTTGISDDGYLSASFDGSTRMDSVIWECKQWNEAKAADVREGWVPECDVWQVIQGLSVSGAEKCLYMVTDGTPEKCVYVWRHLKDGEESTLRAGWAQFDEDAATHEPKEKIPEIVANPQESLPSLSVQMNGEIAIIDNLDRYGMALTAYVEKLNLKPRDDQDFADLDAACKTLKKAEDDLTAGEERALSQAIPLQELRETISRYRELARTTRLRAEKVVKAEKENRREEIRREGVDAYRTHIDKLNTRLGRVRLPDIAADFAGVMKGKRTIESLENAVSVELARVKIASNEMADRMESNLKLIDQAGHAFLFADIQQLSVKDSGDLAELIKARVANHEAEQKRKEDEQRERIRREEEARAQREAEARAEQERARIRQEEQAKAKAEAAKVAEENRASAEDAISSMPTAAKATDLHGPHGSVAYTADGHPAEKPRVRQQAAPAKTRPTDQEIITALAAMYNVNRSTVIEWIATMDLEVAA